MAVAEPWKVAAFFLLLAAVTVPSSSYNVPTTHSSSPYDDFTSTPVGVTPFRRLREKINKLATNVASLASNVANEEPVIPVATGGLYPPPGHNNNRDLYIFDFSSNFPASLFPDSAAGSRVPNNNQGSNTGRYPSNSGASNAPRVPSRNPPPRPALPPTSAFSQGNLPNAVVTNTTPYPPVNRRSLLAAINGIKDFSLDILSTFRVMAGPDNVVFSPVSIASLLSLLTLATNDLADEEIKIALNMHNNLNYHELYRVILQYVNYHSPGLNITTASRMFVDNHVRVKQSFLDNSVGYYDCQVSNENFVHRPEASRSNINSWVESQTNGMITDFISSPIPRQTKMILASTIFFSGAWKTPFPVQMTFERDFNTGTKSVKIPMMTNVFEAPHYYSKLLNVDVVALPYVEEKYALVVILPKEDPKVRSIKQLERDLDSFYVDELLANLTTKQVSVTLPKMRLSMKTQLKENLGQLGVSSIFSPWTSDFSDMSDDKPLFVSQMLHEAVMEIDEFGTVAAAASSVMLDRLGGFPRIVVNKPSILFIAEMQTGLPLFWARLKEPVRL